VATLASPISRNFHSSTLLSWIATGYLIANAAFQPLSGKMSDIYGRKAGIIFASSFFAIGTLICGLAQNAPMMILGRVVAGTGGGYVQLLCHPSRRTYADIIAVVSTPFLPSSLVT
jgi:MFS family permease